METGQFAPGIIITKAYLRLRYGLKVAQVAFSPLPNENLFTDAVQSESGRGGRFVVLSNENVFTDAVRTGSGWGGVSPYCRTKTYLRLRRAPKVVLPSENVFSAFLRPESGRVGCYPILRHI